MYLAGHKAWALCDIVELILMAIITIVVRPGGQDLGTDQAGACPEGTRASLREPRGKGPAEG